MFKKICLAVLVVVMSCGVAFGATRAMTAALTSGNATSGAIGNFKIPNTLQPWNISISGTWVGTVTLQRSFDKGTTWFDVEDFTANTQSQFYDGENVMQYRFGSTISSGTADVRISY